MIVALITTSFGKEMRCRSCVIVSCARKPGRTRNTISSFLDLTALKISIMNLFIVISCHHGSSAALLSRMARTNVVPSQGPRSMVVPVGTSDRWDNTFPPDRSNASNECDVIPNDMFLQEVTVLLEQVNVGEKALMDGDVIGQPM